MDMCPRRGQLQSADLTGQTFGRLTALERAHEPSRASKRALWRCSCSCSCGQETVVASYDLRSGRTRSCGCLLLELYESHRMAALSRRKAEVVRQNGNRPMITNRRVSILQLRVDNASIEPEIREALEHKPMRRSECAGGERPCPWVCRYSLLYEVTLGGEMRETWPHGVPDGAESCALDVADRGEQTMETVARHCNVSRQRVEQVIRVATEKLEEQLR